MPNEYVNKVIYNDQTLLDLTEDSVSPSNVLAGETFHDRSGAPGTGILAIPNVYDGVDSTSSDDALSANMGRALNSKLNGLEFIKYVFDTVERKVFNITIPNNSNHLIIFGDTAIGSCCILYIGATSSGTIAKQDIHISAKYTVTTSKNTLTITSSDTTNRTGRFVDITLYGAHCSFS